MLGEQLQELRIAPTVEETVWAGDPAVAAVTDMAAYVATASAEALELRGGQKASTIKYRGLTDREIMRVHAAAADGGDAQFAEAARYGVVSIAGVHLGRQRFGGVLGLDDATLDALYADRFDLPVTALMNVHARALGIPEAAEKADDVGPLSLALFLGVHVWRLTFFRTRGAP